MAIDPGHFTALMVLAGTLGGAFLTAAGALGGVAVSGFFQERRDTEKRAHDRDMEHERHEHEREVRFHTDRLGIYVRFIDATATVTAAAMQYAANGTDGPLANALAAHLAPYNDSVAYVQMLAKPPLIDRAAAVGNLVGRLLLHNQLSPAEVRAIGDDLNEARSAFITAAKQELGIK